MRNFHVVVICISWLMMLSAAACGAQSGSTQDGSEHTQTAHLTGSAKDLERARFDDPTHIDNRWLPFTPGTQFVYEGSAIVNEEDRQPRRVVTTVTDLTKVIDGVRVLVIWETDYTAGKLSEPELAFFAQDNAGNVWLFGEYPEEYENGKFDKAPAWISGQKGARAGITMPADLRRFVTAQDPVIDRVHAELRRGLKTSHWLWFVIPQVAGLGSSSTASRKLFSAAFQFQSINQNWYPSAS